MEIEIVVVDAEIGVVVVASVVFENHFSYKSLTDNYELLSEEAVDIAVGDTSNLITCFLGFA